MSKLQPFRFQLDFVVAKRSMEEALTRDEGEAMSDVFAGVDNEATTDG